MSAAWGRLSAELDRWAPGAATLWWRDDDARAATAELRRLVEVGRRTGWAPLLAAVPRDAEAPLGGLAEQVPGLRFAVHGWAHVDHGGRRKCEFGPERELEARIADLEQGLDRLTALLGPLALPVLVPPWNRLGDDLVPALPALGFRGLSTLGPRRPGPLPVVNVHLDLVDWKARTFRGEAACLDALAAILAQRRSGAVDATEPTGIMTHHAVHGDDALHFLETLLSRLSQHPSVGVLAPAQAFPDCGAADRLAP
ncbi:polysaccharide deacetylase family protein [Zavarzinia sp. CC-PAN008]|uniref:polysaccharide deacetylase family protein n=1 Tax=Zavarzinia sp. CC-PAN008 TaxID=3243332 RepID=UPI003F749800